jgi:hypothetical protein
MQLNAAGAVAGATPDCTATGLINCKDVNGNDTNTPVRLDGNGKQLTPCGTPTFLPFDIEDETDLNPLFDGLS